MMDKKTLHALYVDAIRKVLHCDTASCVQEMMENGEMTEGNIEEIVYAVVEAYSQSLRQKLLEDLKEAIDNAGNEIGDTIWVDEFTTLWDEIEHIIEKRFRMEDEK